MTYLETALPFGRHKKAFGKLYEGYNLTESRGMPRIAAEFGMGKDGRNAVRVTTTLTKLQHAELSRLADQNSVKVAWMMRRAIERLIDEANRGTLPLDFSLGERRDA